MRRRRWTWLWDLPGVSCCSSPVACSSCRGSVSLPSVSDKTAGASRPASSSNGARSPLAIKVEDVSVTYRTSLEKKPTFKSTVIRLGRRERTVREIEAVKNVSLEVKRGSVVGILGANGAGKSTLVRTMAGILPPTVGRVEVQGRVSTLLALGVGFN